LKHHILDLGQVAFWADQKAKNEFADPGDAWSIAFSTSPK
jgi:hypothetical protein